MTPARNDAEQRALLLALGLSTFVVSLDGRIVAPLLPAIAAEFRTSLATAAYTVSGYLLPYGLCQLAYGPLADRFGKVRVAAHAMVAFSVGTALCGVFSSFGLALAARAFTGAAAAALIPLTIAYIGDVVPYAKRQAALGLLMASSGAAQAFSTSAGGLLAAAMSWRSVFPVVGGVSGLVTAWLFFQSRRVVGPSRHQRNETTYRDALKTALGPLLVLVFVEGALFMGCFPFVSGLLEERFHSRSSVIGVLLGVAGVAQVLTARLLPTLLRRLSEEQMIAVGSSLMAAAYLTCAAAPSELYVAAAAALLGAGFSICHSTLQARATEAFPQGRGRSVALFAFSLFVGGGVGNIAMGVLLQRRGYPQSFTLAGLAFLLFAVLASRAQTSRRGANAKCLVKKTRACTMRGTDSDPGRRASQKGEPPMRRAKFLSILWAVCILTVQVVAWADKPSVIRIGYPSVGIGNRPASFGTSIATVHLKGLLEDEFKKDGIKIQWAFLRGAGPAVNELFANGLLDFSHLGDLPSVVGRASGLKYRVLASSGVRNNIYVSVPADSSIQSVKDLRGKKVAVLKGTATHLSGVKILEKFGLSEKDVRLVNLDTNTAKSALVTKDIDAAIGGPDYLSLRDQGVSRVIFSTKGGDPKLTSNGLFLAAQDFIDKYPDITLRVVKQVVLASKWLADSEKEPAPIFQLWTKSGFTFSGFKEDWTGESLKYRTSPLVDAYVASRYRLQIDEAQRFGLTKRTFSFEEWTELKFLKQALKELGLEQYWKPRGLDGNPSG